MQGLGHAILTGRTVIGDEPFGVVLADDLCFGNGDGRSDARCERDPGL
jgi:UTP--glucose-1-phosphate uridylyltransferase